MKRRGLLLCGAMLTCAGFAGHAAADTPTTTAAPNTTIGEVVVTARRRQENLERVPVAITAFSLQVLKEKSISTAFDLNSAVPGLAVEADSGRGNRPLFAIRGIGEDYGSAAGSVETYFADVPLSGPFQEPSMAPPFYDLESVQVLKGPQGTLFGRSTTGGAVLFVPTMPTDKFGGYARIQGGNYGDFQFEGAVNLPLVEDKASLRIAGFYWTRDGYGHTVGGATDIFGNVIPSQSYDNQDTRSLRVTLKLNPTDQLQNTAIFALNYENSRNTEHAAIVDPNTQLGGLLTLLYPNLTHLSPYVSESSVDLYHLPSTNWAVINTTTYDPTPDLTVKNIFGFIDAKGITDVAGDVDASPLNAIDLYTTPRVAETFQTTDELQLQGREFDNRLTWIVGGLLDVTRQPGGNDIGVFTNLTNSEGGIHTTWQQASLTNYALFGSATFKITDKLSVTAGERHSWDGVHNVSYAADETPAQYEANTELTVEGVPANAQIPLSNSIKSANYQGDTYNIGLEYQADDKTMIYGGYRRGFKQGNFNGTSPVSNPAEASFAPETTDDFYIGLKTRFDLLGMPGRFNIEGYYDLYHDKQLSYLTLTGLPPNFALATVTFNVPATTYRGIDADLALDATPWLRIDANYSYIDAFYTDFPDPTFASAPPGTIDHHLNLAVNPVTFVSPNKVAVTARFHTELPDNRGEIALAPTITYQDRWYQNGTAVLLPQGETSYLGLPYNFNSVALGANYVDSYMLVNVRAEWNRVLGSQIDAALNIVNATNKVYSTGSQTAIAFGVQADSYGPPRMVTFELSTKF